MQDALSVAIDELVDVDVSEWSDAAIEAEFVALRRHQDRLDAHAARLLVGVQDRLIPAAIGAHSTPAWAQWKTGLRVHEAKSLLTAGLACERLPLLEKAWAAAEISSSAARTIARGMKEGHEALYAELVPQLIELARACEFRDLDNVISYYRRCADDLDEKPPQDKNGVFLSEVGDRFALNGDLDSVSGGYVKAALSAAIDAGSGDDRNWGLRNADALVLISRSYLDRRDLPLEGGEAPHLSLVIPWELIHAGVPCKTSRNLNTAISKDEIARLLCDANISRIVLGPDGQPLDVGRSYRTAPRWIRRALAARDGGCRYPGCQRPGKRCEAHHVWAWENGGPTAMHNLVLLCSFHHHVVHRPGWTNTFDGITYQVLNATGIKIE